MPEETHASALSMALARAEHSFFDVFDVGPCHEALFECFSHVELRQLLQGVNNGELRRLVDAFLRRYPIRAADVAVGQHSVLCSTS